jgi:hypothetical protein
LVADLDAIAKLIPIAARELVSAAERALEADEAKQHAS